MYIYIHDYPGIIHDLGIVVQCAVSPVLSASQLGSFVFLNKFEKAGICHQNFE